MDVGGANSVVVTVCFLVGLVWLLLREITVHFDQWVSKGVAMVTGSWVLGGRDYSGFGFRVYRGGNMSS